MPESSGESLYRIFNEGTPTAKLVIAAYRYKLLTARDYLTDQKAVIDGDNEALISLVTFDVTLLGEEWAINRIKEEQAAGNRDFFKKLGKAVQSPKRWGTKKGNQDLAEAIISGFLQENPDYFNLRGNKERFREELFLVVSELNEEGKLPDEDPILTLAANPDYWVKFLRRYRLSD